MGTAQAETMLKNVLAACSTQHPDMAFASDLRGEASAFALLINGQASMALIEREITPPESVPYRKQTATSPFALRVAISAHATAGVYVHRSNPLPQLTLSQLAQIFTQGAAAGNLSYWGQLDLDHPWRQQPICPLSYAEDSALMHYLQQHHFAGRELSAHSEYFADNDALLKRLAECPQAIAIAPAGGENAAIRLLPLAADNATTAQHRLSDHYPLTRYVYLYLSPDADPRLAQFMLSAPGQQIIGQSGSDFFALSASEAAHQQSRLLEPR
ncbi:substrate-binding domain-containing protein [Winslowiella toletana]